MYALIRTNLRTAGLWPVGGFPGTFGAVTRPGTQGTIRPAIGAHDKHLRSRRRIPTQADTGTDSNDRQDAFHRRLHHSYFGGGKARRATEGKSSGEEKALHEKALQEAARGLKKARFYGIL